MKKIFILPFGALIFLCGLVLQFSYETSGGAAWSMLVASLSSSPWELAKPYMLVFIMWSFIELSCLRPRLLHFICARIISLFILLMTSCTALLCLGELRVEAPCMLSVIFICILAAETAEYLMYRSSIRTELFFVPLIISFAVVFFCILFCSFYPPPFAFFRAGSNIMNTFSLLFA